MNVPEVPGGPLERLEVGIPGFDLIALGGLPKGRSTLVSGTAGSGKTMFAVQYLVAGAERYGEPGVLVTLEESAAELIRNFASFGWDLDRLVSENRLAFVDASPAPTEEVVVAGDFDFAALVARIEHAVRRVGAKRVAVETLGAAFLQFSDQRTVRRELMRLSAALRALDVTPLITTERSDEYGAVTHFGVEEYVADNVIVLRNALVEDKRRRTVEILKFRGAPHQKGPFPFAIDPSTGISVLPLSPAEFGEASVDRVSVGHTDLDAMLGGGAYRDSLVLVSGATGSGKTLTAAAFVNAAAAAGERALLFSFEETPERLARNALSWGIDLRAAQRGGHLKIVSRYPERMSTEDLLLTMIEEIQAFGPGRIAIDNLSALGHATPGPAFREFLVGLANELKSTGVTTLVTNTTASLLGGESVTQSQFSTMTDAIVLLRYVELAGEVRRCIVVLKMRGSAHDKSIREYVISERGMNVKDSLEGVRGILMGDPAVAVPQGRP